MYYVNEQQIEVRLKFLPTVTSLLRELSGAKDAQAGLNITTAFAQERALLLGIEVVTDVGSLLIDGFMMRDASSYEDIVDVLQTEGVLPANQAHALKALVALRRPLAQQYMEVDRNSLRPDLLTFAEALEAFAPLVTTFINKELQPFK